MIAAFFLFPLAKLRLPRSHASLSLFPSLSASTARFSFRPVLEYKTRSGLQPRGRPAHFFARVVGLDLRTELFTRVSRVLSPTRSDDTRFCAPAALQ